MPAPGNFRILVVRFSDRFACRKRFSIDIIRTTAVATQPGDP